MLRDRLLAVIADSPGISLAELRAKCPDANARAIHNQLHLLRQAGAIEATSYAHYRVPERRASSAGRTQTGPIARLWRGAKGARVWQGVSHLFDVAGHPKAERAYAWSSGRGDGKRRQLESAHDPRNV